MVKFQMYQVKKHCKHGTRTYVYRGILLRLPKKFHEKIIPVIGETFEMKSVTISGTINEELINIVLVRKKHATDKQMI